MTIEERAEEMKENLISEGMDKQIAEYCKQAFKCGCVSQEVICKHEKETMINTACKCIEESVKIIGIESHAEWLNERIRKAMEG